jgi:hypothetical protein
LKKLPKEATVYMGPQLIQREATCDGCIMFIIRRTEGSKRHGVCEILYPELIDGDDGCTLYVPGKARTAQSGHRPLRLVPATAAGLEEGPFTCKRCKHFGGSEDSPGPCEIVEGTVHPDACCNAWSKGS